LAITKSTNVHVCGEVVGINEHCLTSSFNCCDYPEVCCQRREGREKAHDESDPAYGDQRLLEREPERGLGVDVEQTHLRHLRPDVGQRESELYRGLYQLLALLRSVGGVAYDDAHDLVCVKGVALETPPVRVRELQKRYHQIAWC
jgi:hypothetical protein